MYGQYGHLQQLFRQQKAPPRPAPVPTHGSKLKIGNPFDATAMWDAAKGSSQARALLFKDLSSLYWRACGMLEKQGKPAQTYLAATLVALSSSLQQQLLHTAEHVALEDSSKPVAVIQRACKMLGLSTDLQAEAKAIDGRLAAWSALEQLIASAALLCYALTCADTGGRKAAGRVGWAHVTATEGDRVGVASAIRAYALYLACVVRKALCLNDSTLMGMVERLAEVTGDADLWQDGMQIKVTQFVKHVYEQVG
jgi:hypothetical protein